jgi:hypothetical protein
VNPQATDNQGFAPSKVYRFDIFMGRKDTEGRIQKVRSIGVAYHTDGQATYSIRLKTFLDDAFFLLPEKKSSGADFLILTRVPAKRAGKPFFWNTVGEAKFLRGPDSGFMHLVWDLFGGDNIYMDLYPKETSVTDEMIAPPSSSAPAIP